MFSCSMQQQRTVSRLDCDVWRKVDCARQPAVTSSVMKPRSGSKAKLAPKKGHGHCLVALLPVWSTTAFWVPEKPSHPRSTLGKMMRMRGAEGCRARSRHGPPGRAGSSPWQTLTDVAQPTPHKLKESGYDILPQTPIFTWPFTNWSLLLQASQQLFAGKMILQSTGGRKCFPGVCQIRKHGLLCSMNKLLTGKNVSIVMVPILINKDVFEPSYNDLKFMDWKC